MGEAVENDGGGTRGGSEGGAADCSSAFPEVFKAVNSRITLGANEAFAPDGGPCYAITDGGVFTGCNITLKLELGIGGLS